MTSSRRSCSKSTSISGGSPRFSEMKRAKKRLLLSGLTEVMPRQKQTALLAAEPRPWQRISLSWRARECNHVMDGEEVARIIELGDEREFVVKPLANIVGNAVGIFVFRIALLRARPGEILQMLLGGLAWRHWLVGIFVFEFAKREAAGFGDGERAGDGVGKVRRTAAPFPPAL